MDVRFDPLLILTVRLGIGALFAAAFAHKFARFAEFEGTLTNYLKGMGFIGPRLFGGAIVRPLAGLVLLAEAIIVLISVLPQLLPFPGVLAALVLAGYALAMGLNLARGNPLPDCGCSWGKTPQPIGAGLVLRNMALALIALLAGAATNARALDGLDYVSAAVALLVFTLAYAAINQLLTLTDSNRGNAA